jgi:hypothetical protein
MTASGNPPRPAITRYDANSVTPDPGNSDRPRVA